ncbi:MAG: alpha-1,2-fucosyltransferase [Deltaproteobacteria bacterium]|nr:alpha-1,2-fucosyltransferase [Deltaproteobacteria bacterium]
MREDLEPRRPSLDSLFPERMAAFRAAAARASGGLWTRVPRHYAGQSIDIEQVVRERSPQIFLSGYFEDYSIYKPYKQEVRELYRFSTPLQRRPAGDWAIHLRFNTPKELEKWSATGDGVPVERDAELREYYLRVLARLDLGQLHIVTNRPDHPYIDRFSEYKPRVISGSIPDDFRALASFSNIVMSPSTFSWWAAWLSSAHRVVFPPFRFWRHPHQQAGSLFVDDEERFQLIEV